MIVTSRAPVRVDFAGGWTDVNLFARGAGGAVVNAAIDRYVTGRLEVQDTEATVSDGEGLRITYGSDLPSGSGLGTSSAMNVAWLSLVKHRIIGDEDRARLAELAYQLEEILGILGGKQDQYAAAFGGFNFMTFGEKVDVERLDIAPETIQALEEDLVLCYTGKPRLSGNIHENVWGAFRQGVPETVNALYTLRDCAFRMREALLQGDLDAFATILSENWKHQRALDPSVTNSQIENLFEVAFQFGARGGKACGAGGGGCLLFCAENGRKPELSAALDRAGTRVIPFHFDLEGLTITHE